MIGKPQPHDSSSMPVAHTCIYSKKRFANADGEHILQNFLGARWTSNVIAANEAQHSFSSTIDLALMKGLENIRVHLGVSGGRGGTPRAVIVDTTSGMKVRYDSAGRATLHEPAVVVNTDDPNFVRIAISDVGDVPWAVKKLKERFPNLDEAKARSELEAAASSATKTVAPPDDRVHLGQSIGGRDFFRGILKSAFNLLGANNPALALTRRFDELRQFILHNAGTPRRFVRWATNDSGRIARIGPFDHLLAVYSSGSTIQGYARLFDVYQFSFRLASGYWGKPFFYSYQVDPTRSGTAPVERRNEAWPKGALPKFFMSQPLPNGRVRRDTSNSLNIVLGRKARLIEQEQIGALLDEVMADSKTPNEIVGKLAEALATRFGV